MDLVFSTQRRVLNYIQTNGLIQPGMTVIVGLSGGADSVCLFDILCSLREELSFNIRAVHIHHGIRGDSADKDAEFCSNLCKDAGVPIAVIKKDIPAMAKDAKETVEECARKVRYEEFGKTASESGKSVIAVAHHKNDQAETVLFRMSRGTGVKGIGAMRPQNDNVIRPLLCLHRAEIEAYLDAKGIGYCLDETNEDIDYSRNRIRHNVIPELIEISPEAVEHIAQLSEDAALVSDFLDREATKAYEDAKITEANVVGDRQYTIKGARVVLDVERLLSDDKIIRRYVLRMAVEECIMSLKDVTREHVAAIEGILEGAHARSVDLPKGLTVVREQNLLGFCLKKDAGTKGDIAPNAKENTKNDWCVPLTPGEDVILPDGRRLKSEICEDFDVKMIPQNLYTKWLDYDKIYPGLCVRYRREGDTICIDQNGSTKSVKDYMINEKIPKSMRGLIPIVATQSKAVWIIGYRISENAKITVNTKRIIKFEIIEGEDHE